MVDGLLTLTLSNLPNARLASLTHQLERDLSRCGVCTRVPKGPQSSGERGDPVTLGVLALALINRGAAASLLGCLKAYLSREKKLSIKITHQNGDLIEIDSLNIDTVSLRKTLEATISAMPK